MPRSRVIVEFPDRPAYAVRIGGGLAAQLGADLRSMGVQAHRCLVICDSEAQTRCLPALKASLTAAGLSTVDMAVPAVDPGQAWECAGELHRALSGLALPEGSPIVICAGVEAGELIAFAASLYAGSGPLVIVPASLAASLRLIGIDRLEVDTGLSHPLCTQASPAFACIDTDMLACESEAERALGLDELSLAAGHCDAEFNQWLDGSRAAIAAYDEDALVLALTQTIAARADYLGRRMAARNQR